jgi:3-hydroxyacyl-CoA dehydrogenase
MNFLIIGNGTMGKGVARMLIRNDINPQSISLRTSDDIPRETKEIIRQADIILECISENLAHKESVLKLISSHNSCGIIASCTSSLSISELQKNIASPSRFLGVHFMNPPTLIPFVEVIPGEQTASATINEVVDWLDSINRKVLVVPDVPGFVLNSVLFSMLNRAAYLLEGNDLDPIEVDDLLVGVCGHKLGPLATMDLIGLDVVLQILENLYSREPILNSTPAPIIKRFVKEGKLGKKSQQGFYAY